MMTLGDSQSRVGVTLDDVMAWGFPCTNSHSFPRKHNNVVNRKGRGFYWVLHTTLSMLNKFIKSKTVSQFKAISDMVYVEVLGKEGKTHSTFLCYARHNIDFLQ